MEKKKQNENMISYKGWGWILLGYIIIIAWWMAIIVFGHK